MVSPPWRQLDVLLVSTSYPASLQDWRGLFIRYLADALAGRDDLNLSLWAPHGDVHPRIQRVCTPADDAWLAELVRRGGIAQLLRKKKISGVVAAVALLRRLRRLFMRQTPDIYHINWLQNALSLPRDGRPALITVLGADMRLLKWPGMKISVRRICAGRRVAICPNADWMVSDLKSAFDEVAQVRTVVFGVDPCWYQVSRRIDETRVPNWLVIARLTRDKVGKLFDWGEGVFGSGHRNLHLFGPMVEPLALPSWVNYHGPATPEGLRKQWFPTAHGLITLSEHSEGRPQVILEAMAAGLPVIASRLPAHENLIKHRSTGWLTDSPKDFETALTHLESSAHNIAVGQATRAYARTEFGTWDDCAQRYDNIYRQLVSAG